MSNNTDILPAAAGGAVAVGGGYTLPADYNPEHSGLEETTSSGGVPYIKMLQPMSPEVTEGDLKPGLFYHTTTEEAFETFKFVPALIQEYAVKWLPRGEGEGSGFISRHTLDDEEVKNSYYQATGRNDMPWGKFPDSNPESKAEFVVTKYLFGTMITADEDLLPFCYGFKSTHIPAIEQFKQRAKSLQAFHPHLNRKVLMPLYLVRWTMISHREKNDKGVFYVPEMKIDAIAKKEEAYLRADDPAAQMSAQLYKQIRAAKSIDQVIRPEDTSGGKVEDEIPF